MAKGMPLKFLGHALTREEMAVLASCLGRNTYPQFNGWGPASGRNYLAYESGRSFDICTGLVSRGIMDCETRKPYTYFHVTDLGRRIFDLFRRHHRRPRLNLWKDSPKRKK